MKIDEEGFLLATSSLVASLCLDDRSEVDFQIPVHTGGYLEPGYYPAALADSNVVQWKLQYGSAESVTDMSYLFRRRNVRGILEPVWRDRCAYL